MSFRKVMTALTTSFICFGGGDSNSFNVTEL